MRSPKTDDIAKNQAFAVYGDNDKACYVGQRVISGK